MELTLRTSRLTVIIKVRQFLIPYTNSDEVKAQRRNTYYSFDSRLTTEGYKKYKVKKQVHDRKGKGKKKKKRVEVQMDKITRVDMNVFWLQTPLNWHNVYLRLHISSCIC